MPDIEFKRVPIDTLHEDPANARRHPERNRAAVRSSLSEFGQVEALVVQRGTGRVIGGNCRLGELRALGVEEVQVAEVDLHSIDATRLALALNRTAEIAEWDTDGLTALLKSLDDEDALGGLGWDDAELELLLEGAGAVGDDEWGAAAGGLPDSDRAPIQQMTFTLHDKQAEAVKAAVERAKAQGPFVDTGNENSNGNALARICEAFRG